MADAYQPGEDLDMVTDKPGTSEIVIPDGYELAHYTLRRKCDGHMQTYTAVDLKTVPVQAVPIPNAQSNLKANSSSPTPPISNIPAHKGAHEARAMSAITQKRHAHTRDDNFTDVCGVFSPEKAKPFKRYNYGKGSFCCPRCRSNFTRPKSVKDHFPDCVRKYGNPQALRYNDHPSMGGQESEGKGTRIAEVSSTLAHTSIRDGTSLTPTPNDPPIKQEFVFGADIPYESVEAPILKRQSSSTSSEAQQSSSRPTSIHGPVHAAELPIWYLRNETPDWLITSANTSLASGFRTQTAPLEGWPSETTPAPTNGDGLREDDDPGNFMDRQSYSSATPAPWRSSAVMENISEECEMDDEMAE